MEGIIITYNVKTAKEITELNNLFFGRVVKINRNNNTIHYYYKGLLDDKLYYKLSNGCYFLKATKEFYKNSNIPEVKMILTNLSIEDSDMTTARDHFRNKYQNITVKNIDRTN